MVACAGKRDRVAGLFGGHALGQVTGPIDVRAPRNRDAVRKDLQRQHREEWLQHGRRVFDVDKILAVLLDGLVTLVATAMT